jgi:hypothetical protein
MSAVKFINLTPHVVCIRVPAGTEIVVPASGKTARVDMEEREMEATIGGIPLIRRQPKGVILPEGLEIDACTWLIVSSMVLEAAERLDHPMLRYLVAPDTGVTAIRENGQVVAVTRLVEPNIRRV